MKKIALFTLVLAAGTGSMLSSGGQSVTAAKGWCAPPAHTIGSGTQGPTTLWPC